MSRYKKLTFEEHLEIAKDLNDMRRRLQQILNRTGQAEPKNFRFNKLLWRMVGGLNNIFGELRSSLEDNMYAHWRDHSDAPKDLTTIYFPGDKYR
jgi:hypothetical protein